MVKNLLLIGIAAFIAVFAIAAVACDDDDENGNGGGEATVDSSVQLCNDLLSLDAALASLNTALQNPDGTVGEVRTAADSAKSALEQVESSADTLGEERVSAVEDAYSDLDSSVQDLPDEATVEDALAALSADLAAVGDAERELFSALNCG